MILAILDELFACRGHNQYAVLDPLGRDQLVGYFFHFLVFAPNNQSLQSAEITGLLTDPARV